jgi:hypothetical protein
MRFPARALYEQRLAIRDDLAFLRELCKEVGSEKDLNLAQWCSWYAAVLDFKPDLIIELGRGKGNSTALFTQAANRLGDVFVASFCKSTDWEAETGPRLVAKLGADWFSPLKIYRIGIEQVDFSFVIGDAKRILLLWDAHGMVVAGHVLSHVMPMLAKLDHLVICHDVSDNRMWPDASRSYEGRHFWHGMDAFEKAPQTTARLNILWLNTVVDQFIPILDFCWRNRIELHSADWEVKEDLVDCHVKLDAVRAVLPDDAFSPVTHWAYFTMNESSGPWCFPAMFT